ncbi:hypothetical protein [Terrimonas alba]|uniref:hypothetical protein n=1 Tax=Terrimonas alba TaxID=3349636 RepID=UPI0035F44EAB
MINNVIFIMDFGVQDVNSLHLLPGDNCCYSLVINPSVNNELNDAYQLIQNAEHLLFSLTVKVQESLSPEEITSIAAFLFLPTYFGLNGKCIVSMLGKSRETLEDAAIRLSDYLLQQGIKNVSVHKLLQGDAAANEFPFFQPGDQWYLDYLALLQSGNSFDKPVFFYASSTAELKTAIINFQMIEASFKQESPRIFELILRNRELQHETDELKRRLIRLEGELNNQTQYNEILRSDHSTKDLQLYYNKEYEILPLWYKRFGHILKALTGKRTFRSLFRDDVKKYKD